MKMLLILVLLIGLVAVVMKATSSEHDHAM